MPRIVTPQGGVVAPIVMNRSSQFARNLIGWWPLADRVSWGGLAARDYSGAHQTGTLRRQSGDGPPGWVPQGSLGAVEFEAVTSTNGEEILVENAKVPTIGSGGDVCFSTWIFPHQVEWDHRILVCSDTGDALQCTIAVNLITWMVGGYPTGYTAALLPSPPFPSNQRWRGASLNIWHHILVQRRVGKMEIFHNGRQLELSTGSETNTQTPNTPGQWCFGFRGIPAGGGWEQHPYLGAMRDIRIWSTGLSPAQVAQLYRETRGGSLGSLASAYRIFRDPAEGAAAVAQSAPIFLATTQAGL